MQIYKILIYLHIFVIGAFWIRHKILWTWVQIPPAPPLKNICTYGRVVEGTGLIIHFRKNVTGSNPVRCIN